MANITPGSRITWTQRVQDGRAVVRTGTVIDRAPTPESKGYGFRRKTAGFKVAYWVLPDEADARDTAWFVVVAKSTVYPKGELFSSWSPECTTYRVAMDGLHALALLQNH